MSWDTDDIYSSDDDRPKTPQERDCCGGGCSPCIFDSHKIALEEWRNRRTYSTKAQNAGDKTQKNLLSPASYTKFIITNRTDAAEDYFRLQLEHKDHKTGNNNLHFVPGQFVILNSDSKSRPYTALTWTDKSFDILVRWYKDGEFSTLLKTISLGSAINVRGPYGKFKYQRNSFQDIVMFGIGSGIAPFYPIVRTIVSDSNEETRIHLIAGFQTVAHVPLKKELQKLTDFWNFKCTLYLSDETNEKTIHIHGFDVKIGLLTKLLTATHLQSKDREKTLVLICGSPEFNNVMKQWVQEVNYTNMHVF